MQLNNKNIMWTFKSFVILNYLMPFSVMLLEYISIQRVSLGVNKCNGVINHYVLFKIFYVYFYY